MLYRLILEEIAFADDSFTATTKIINSDIYRRYLSKFIHTDGKRYLVSSCEPLSNYYSRIY